MEHDRRSTVRGTSREIRQAARELRGDLTPAEGVLWEAIRREQLHGLRFRRQHPLGRFIVDFCCPGHHLAVEVDGASHDDREEYDAVRTEVLTSHGYRVLRFRNEEVIADLPSVLRRIVAAAFRHDP